LRTHGQWTDVEIIEDPFVPEETRLFKPYALSVYYDWLWNANEIQQEITGYTRYSDFNFIVTPPDPGTKVIYPARSQIYKASYYDNVIEDYVVITNPYVHVEAQIDGNLVYHAASPATYVNILSSVQYTGWSGNFGSPHPCPTASDFPSTSSYSSYASTSSYSETETEPEFLSFPIPRPRYLDTSNPLTRTINDLKYLSKTGFENCYQTVGSPTITFTTTTATTSLVGLSSSKGETTTTLNSNTMTQEHSDHSGFSHYRYTLDSHASFRTANTVTHTRTGYTNWAQTPEAIQTALAEYRLATL